MAYSNHRQYYRVLMCVDNGSFSWIKSVFSTGCNTCPPYFSEVQCSMFTYTSNNHLFVCDCHVNNTLFVLTFALNCSCISIGQLFVAFTDFPRFSKFNGIRSSEMLLFITLNLFACFTHQYHMSMPLLTVTVTSLSVCTSSERGTIHCW